MIAEKAQALVDLFQPNINLYWKQVTQKNIIHVKTKDMNTPYFSHNSETFLALQLPYRNVPGFGIRDLRIIRLDQDLPEIIMIPISWVETINHKPVGLSEWQVNGSKGNTYTVKLIGEYYKCTCPGFKYRHQCKHIDKVKET